MIDFQDTTQYKKSQATFDRAYPNFRNAGQQYQDILRELICPSTMVLELGCGRTSLAVKVLRQAKLSVGIDLDIIDLSLNDTVRYAVMAVGESIPFPSNSFDLLISQWVFEHLENPLTVIKEIGRVLKPGGRAVIFTTNSRNYVALISRLLPNFIRCVLVAHLLKRPTHETFRTFYRANTCEKIVHYAQKSDLRVEQCEYIGNPFYLAFSHVLFRLALLYEKVTDLAPLRRLKVYLLVTLVKPEVCNLQRKLQF